MTSTPPPRPSVVIDTSVALPILLREDPLSSTLMQLCHDRLLIPLVTPETIGELDSQLLQNIPITNLTRARRTVDNKLRLYLSRSDELPTTPPPSPPQCRDPKDQKFIDLAMSADADYLITSDQDLISLESQVPFRILTERDFLNTAAHLML